MVDFILLELSIIVSPHFDVLDLSLAQLLLQFMLFVNLALRFQVFLILLAQVSFRSFALQSIFFVLLLACSELSHKSLLQISCNQPIRPMRCFFPTN